MADALLKHHPGAQHPGAVENHLPRLHPKGSGDPRKTGEVTFLVGDVPAAVPVFHGSLGDQLDGLRLLVGVALASLNGQNYVLFHLHASRAREINSSIS